MRTPAERQLNRLARPFLRAIRAEPDNDLPRLVFADWLDERGDPLGEFIRGQCSRQGPATTVTHRGRQWPTTSKPFVLAFGPAGAFGGAPLCQLRDDTYLTYRRGFLDEVACHPTEWVRLRRRLRHPVRIVRLTGLRMVSRFGGTSPGPGSVQNEAVCRVQPDGCLVDETGGTLTAAIGRDLSMVSLGPRWDAIRPLRSFNAASAVTDETGLVRSVPGASQGASARPTLPNP